MTNFERRAHGRTTYFRHQVSEAGRCTADAPTASSPTSLFYCIHLLFLRLEYIAKVYSKINSLTHSHYFIVSFSSTEVDSEERESKKQGDSGDEGEGIFNTAQEQG